MAPSTDDSVYFPPLDKCLSGEHQLLSWKVIYLALCDNTELLESTNARPFLSDEISSALLAQPLQPFKAPSPQTKTEFETKTSAINVTPSDNGHYDIKQIKEDTLWLSKETHIDEIAALRLVMLEWQTRPAEQLLSGFTEEETLSIQDATGTANLSASSLLLKSSVLAAPAPASSSSGSLAAFHSDQQRHLRLLALYLSERSYILRTSEILAREGAGRKQELSAQSVPQWLAKFEMDIFDKQLEAASQSYSKVPFLGQCVEALKLRLSGLGKGSGWFQADGENVDAEEMWSKNRLVEIIHILQLMFTHIHAENGIFDSDTVQTWFDFLGDYGFFRTLPTPFAHHQPLVSFVQTLISVVSLAILKLPNTLRYLADVTLEDIYPSMKNQYISDPQAANKVTSVLVGSVGEPNPASPALFAWSIILLTVREVVFAIRERDFQLEPPDSPTNHQRPQTPSKVRDLEKILESIPESVEDEDTIAYLAKAAVVGAQVFAVIGELARSFVGNFAATIDRTAEQNMRLVLLDLIKEGVAVTTYSNEVIAATFDVLTGGRQYWDLAYEPLSRLQDPVVKAFCANADGLMLQIFENSLLRYPYEPIPFIKFCSALVSGMKTEGDEVLPLVKMLQNMSKFTQKLPPHFNAYELMREEENANCVALTQNLELFIIRQSKPYLMGTSTSSELVLANKSYESQVIPQGTIGYIIDDQSKPFVASWEYHHSALSYLGCLLSTATISSDHVDYASQEPLSLEIAADIIALLAVLLQSTLKAAESDGWRAAPADAARSLLEEASNALGRDQDIVTVVFEVFEQALQFQKQQPGDNGSMEVLIHGLEFIHSLTTVMPSRVWPFLTRSRLLDIDGKGGSLVEIVAATEMVTGNYDFLLGSIKLCEALVEDSVKSAISRRRATKSIGRFQSAELSSTGTPEKVLSKVLTAFQRILMSVFESSPSWKFTNIAHRLDINSRIPGIFNMILTYAYGFDDESLQVSQKLTGVLAASAEYLVGVFLSTSDHALPTHPILNILLPGTDTPTSTVHTASMQSCILQTQKTLSLSTTLLRIGTLLDKPTSHLEIQLLKASPILTRLFALHDSYKTHVVTLLETLVRSAGRTAEEPQSLLGHLGPETAKCFLSVLSNLARPLENRTVEVAIWNLLSAVVSCKQQWFAIYLLTGSTPRDSVKKKDETNKQPRGKPLLRHALDELSETRLQQPQRALAMLEFIALAQNHWPWAMHDLRSHSKFLSRIMDFLGSLNHNVSLLSLEKTVDACYDFRIASFCAEILAMYLHHTRQLGDTSAAKDLIPKLNYLRDHAVDVPHYNTSLHSNLKRNFEKLYPGCKLLNFKNTLLTQTDYGKNYFYGLELASKAFSSDSSRPGRGSQGFSEEFERANVNISLVDSQVHLLKGWKILAVELSNLIPKYSQLPEILATVIASCLKANTVDLGPLAVFDRLTQIRADFAFVLMQRLASAKCQEKVVQKLFLQVWEATRTNFRDFETAFTGDSADDYRTLVKILFLSLQSHHTDSRPRLLASASTSGNRAQFDVPPVLIEILAQVVAKGFQGLATQLHEDSKSCFPSDFVLLTALLQTILRYPNIQSQYRQIALEFAHQNTSKYATTLYTWADQLTIDRDPIYGELSILFLLELSSVPSIAENLAIEGVLAQLSAANLSSYFRRQGGMGPFNEPTRLYSIWTRGILPLCLNLLYAVGAPVASEVSAFLNQFPQQLSRAATAFASRAVPTSSNPNAGQITLAMASEVHSLALIALVLERCRESGAAAGAPVTEILDLTWDRVGVREDIDGWLQGRRGLRDRIAPVNEREAELTRAKPLNGSSGAENRLEEKVVAELKNALEVLNGFGSL